ncbi:MAG: 4-(cytidine 5'-diphospho)-2-C-methyl-D-erythritol kinase [Planctomycetes bacterium]|nr:4-(cytidine 5'-diphospho)-2-C-methyl-D-erythritol kinase [Planctomycetota bacterium]
MYLRRDQLTRTARAPAKLNLYLEILGRRDDGFHELETLMVPIRLSDGLSFASTLPIDDRPGEIVLGVRKCFPARSSKQTDTIPTGSSNLVVRALELLRERSGCQLGAHVELVKRIPAAAGLGGGSSDAAAALRLANRGWQLDWPVERLAELAAELGSDVPFFLHGGAAICSGRGERVERVHGIRPCYFVIVKPPADLSTAEVYRAHDSLDQVTNPPGRRGLLQASAALRSDGLREAGRWMFNRLQFAAGAVSPWVDRLRTVFARLDCVGHQLSGSGSAYFGVCRHAQHARRLATILRTQQLGLVYATRSCA